MLERIKTYVAAFLAVLMAVRELVELFEVPKHGEHKREAVLRGIEILVDLADDFLGWLPTEKIMAVADAAIELWVRFKNLTGSWQSKDAETALGN